MTALRPPAAPPAFFTTLAEALRFRAATQPDRRAYTFLADGEEEDGHLDYAGLDARARAIAAALQRDGRRGDRVLLLYPPGLDFVAAFFGCLYAGMVAVPAYPPRSPRTLPRLQSILADCAPAVALSALSGGAAGGRARGWLERAAAEAGQAPLPWIDTDRLPAGLEDAWRDPGLRGDDLAFLQYTSGSTSTPKGVMVSHVNLAHNQRVIQGACEHSGESVFVTWLPLYHDLGLIGNLLQATWVGAPCVLMAPVAFLQNPSRWLRAVARYRGTTSGGPNFAYDLCVRKIPVPEREKLDLSSWRVAFNGAEPVRAETLERFAEAFAPAGFRAASHYPCYGLAEATLMVSGGRPDAPTVVRAFDPEGLASHQARPQDGGRELVGCGRILADLRVAIADPETGAPLPPGRIGEIWVAGDSVARGYWNRPEESAQTFGARLAGDGADGPSYLRTGDLGFLDDSSPLTRGELFITGRLKDLIILRGRNHYPQDIEATVQAAHPALAGTGAAFAFEQDGEERLVVVQEVERHTQSGIDEIAEAVRRAVAEQHEAYVHELVLVPQGGVPRTTSGKVQRRASRDLYLRGELRPVGSSRLDATPDAPLEGAETEGAGPVTREAILAVSGGERVALAEAWLRRAFARLARIDPARIDPARPLSGYGLDSLVAVELKNAAEAELGASLSLAALLEGVTLGEAASQALESLGSFEAAEIPAGDPATAPLSYGQRSLWFLHRLAPDSAAYNIAGAAWLQGGPGAEALRRAFQTLTGRHPVLRTTFEARPEGPAAVLHERLEPGFVHADASEWTEDELRRRIHEEAFRPFDLTVGPLLRAALFEHPGGKTGESVLVLAVHHVAADFWSLAVLGRELGALAGGAEPSTLPPLDLTYGDWSRWQERRLAGPEGERLWGYWREQLAGAPALDLPTDRPRPPVQSFRGAAVSRRLPAAASDAIRGLAAAHGCTLFMALTAAFQALLARTTGQPDFLVGSPTSGRSSGGLGERLAGLVGYFVNPVALRADLAGDPPAAEALARVRRTALAAFEHQDFPFVLLAERLETGRDAGRPALLQAMLGFEKAPDPDLAPMAAFALGEGGARLELGALRLESLPLETPATQFDLTLLAAELPDLTFSLQYSTDLFDGATAERLLDRLVRLLEGMASDPASRLSDLPLLAEAERRQVVAEWNATRTDYPCEAPVHRVFEAQAARQPDRVAISEDSLELTYRELNERANRLARHLQKLGVGPETRVGTVLPRSAGLVTAFLAILKAGGVYVPFDMSYPPERIAALSEEAGLGIVLTEDPFDEPPEAAALPSGNLETAVSGRHLAYIMFTSGSTGRPKPVGIEHRGVVRLACNTDYVEYGPQRSFLHISTPAFDASTFEIWGPLLNGGRTVVFPGHASDLAALGAAIARHGADTLFLTTGLFHQIVESRIEILRPLKDLLTGGDAASPEHFQRVRAELPGTRITNLYGPTENTSLTTFHAPDPGAPLEVPIPIGGPIANNRVYVVDRALRPVPPGVPGELVAGGDGLARGYLGRPDLTAERFVPSPFAAETGEPGERLYRTGDRVRWRRDGKLVFLGRLDHQVKIRGFRVEPGEVEAALMRHPGVREAAVRVEGSGAAGKRLIAYAGTGDPAPAVTPAALRDFLRGVLPDYMVPAGFAVLERLPLSASGKVDRAALARLTPELAGDERPYTAPRTPVEEAVAGIWADLLGVERVGIDDDFFERGGHSLLAARAVARLREPFGIELPLSTLFARPTVAAFAAAVEQARRADTGPEGPALVPVPRGGGSPLSFAQERLWFLDRLAPGGAVYNIPAALELRGDLDPAALAAALSRVVARHEALRTVFAESAGEAVQRVRPAAPIALPEVDLAALPADLQGHEADRIEAAEVRRPFDLRSGPLLRALLIRAGERAGRLVLNLHHIAADGWSLEILLADLAALLSGVPLPDLPVQYADFAAWQRAALTEEALAPQIAWWREQLAGLPEALDLPADRPRPPAQTFRGGAVPVAVPAPLADALRALARRQGATLFVTLLGGFAALLERYTGQPEVAVGAPVAGRSRPELERLVGFFVNTLPLPVRLGDEPAAALIGRLRDLTLAAYERQDVPFERLVEELAPRRDLSRSPLFQAMLAVQDGAPAVLRLPGLEPAPLRLISNGTAKFDLTLSLSGAPEGGLAGGLEMSFDVLEHATAARLARHLVTLLSGLAADPGRPVSHLPLLAAAERAQLAGEQSRTPGHYKRDVRLHDLFAEQAARTPDAVAVVDGDLVWTYAELAARARGIARELRHRGAGPEARVAVFAERSAALAAAFLGILEAGAAVVPLDPAYPAERLELILADSGVAAVLAEERVAAQGLEGLQGPERLWLSLEPLLSLGSLESFERPPADALAYIIYTSGSTGLPKGVGLSHANAVPLFLWARGFFGFDERTRVLQTLSPAFDFGVMEILTTLFSGGQLHIPARGAANDPVRWAAYAAGHGIDTVHATPAFFREVAAAGARLPGARVLHLGGEALTRADLDLFRGENGVVPAGCPVFNGYGPTETTVNCMAFRAGPGWTAALPGLPIGRPSVENAIYLLEPRFGAWGEPVPPGVPGELFVGGPGVARGYLGRPGLTAERFLPDPFAAEPGARLYRSGDLARWLPSGDAEFLGRVDQQVKIRGFRIEPGEVEAALAAHPAIAAAAVLARDGRLVAYAVPRQPDTAPAPAELRSFLAARLPAPMVPAAYALLPELPLTPSGKVDRRALGRIEPAAPAAETAPETLRTPVEELIAGLWADLLGVETVGAQDDFFALGGHSLQGIRLVSRLREAFGVELEVRALFEAPTVRGLAAEVSRRLSGAAAGEPALAVRAGGAGPRPFSFAQERLWFLEQLQPGSALYHMPAAARLAGPLSPAALRAALDALEERHESLRTVVSAAGQTALPPAGIPLPLIDLAGLPAGRREGELADRLREEARRPFDLERGPLVRTPLFRLGGEDHALLLGVHHIVSDGWSTGVFLRELAALYEAALAGRPAALAPLPLSYADWAAWQRESLGGERLEAQLAWWRERLAGVPPLDLPADRPRPAAPSGRGRQQETALPEGALAALQAFSRREGATPFMVLLAAFQALLARSSGQEDVAVGSPVANRNRSAVEGVIGLFVNTVVMRADLGGDPPFRALLGRVREATLGAYAHEETPFEKVVEAVQPDRDLSRTPLFQTMLVLQNQPWPELRIGDLALTPSGVDTGVSKFDLTLVWREERGRLVGLAESSADLFDAATVDRFGRHYGRLLEAALAGPETRLDDLPLLDAAEAAQVLAWSRGPGRYPGEGTIHGVFESQARQTPEATAVVTGGRAWTYAELDRAAQDLAATLRARGVGPEERVGLLAERSAGLVTGVLAILKAGGVLVPLDPAYPRERLELILEDSGAALVLHEGPQGPEGLPGRRELLSLESLGSFESFESFDRAEVLPGHLAYLIYTSGSTGRPKGVAVTHANAAPLLAWSLEAFGLGPHTRTLPTLSPAFDFGLWEILTTLIAGGTLHLEGRETTQDPARWAERAAQAGITTVHATPSFFREVAALGARLPEVRVLHLGGEALTWGDVERMRAAARDGCLVFNGYGPTEATVNCLLYPAGERSAGSAGVPLGRPSAENAVYIAGRGGAPVPAGAPGELWVGGPGVARGYLGRPDLTAERFLPDPFAGETGARLYRTGDLTRWLPSGDLEFLGRIDQQVKVRGFRIELGEIESALLAHPAVAEAAAVVAQGQLLACVVPAGAEAPDPSELRAFLLERLPAPLVPARFAFVEALPRTPNGKLDRRTLARLDAAGEAAREREHAPPVTPIQKRIAAIWEELLKVEPVGLHDSFFELGGHSLLATQALSRLREAFGIEIPLRTLFESPTVEALAAAVKDLYRKPQAARAEPPRSQAGAAPAAASPAPEETGEPRVAPLSFAQERLWFLEQLQPGTALYNMPAAARASGPLHPGALAAALTALERRHAALRTLFTEVDGQPVQVVFPPSGGALPLIDLSGLPAARREEELADRIHAEARRPFDLESGPLLRTLLYRLSGAPGQEDHTLSLDLHHIVADGWSIGVLLRELAAFYAAALAGVPAPVTPLPLQYADWAEWQRDHLTGDVLAGQLAWWSERLADLPPLDLPADRPRPAVPSHRGRQRSFELPAALTAALNTGGRSEGATVFMVLLAAFQAVLARWSGQTDVAIGSPVANRGHRHVEGLIGLFANTVVLRADLGGDPAFRVLLGRVREATLGAYAHEETPFEKVVEAVHPERDLSRTPLFQAMMVLQNQPWPDLRIGDLRLVASQADTGVSKFDLTLLWHEQDGVFTGVAESSADLFDVATIERLCAHLRTLLAAALARPETRLSELPLLAPGERGEVLAWSRGPAHGRHAGTGTVHGLFEAQARRTPDALAVVAERTWTYAELDQAAGRLAAALRERGVGPEDRVGVLAGRSAGLVVGLLGVLKAGGVFVPLDPGYPRERLQVLVEDSGAAVVLHEGPEGPQGLQGRQELVSLESLESTRSFEPAEVLPDHLAYLIYTSGSTGRPKAVAVSHANALPLLAWSVEAFGMGPHTWVLQTLSPAFDFGLWEILTTLIAGGTLHLSASAGDPAAWAEQAARAGITTVHATPSFFREVAALGVSLPAVSVLHLGGEALAWADVERMRAAVGAGCAVFNGYGPTEATVNCLLYRAAEAGDAAGVPLGRPSADNTVYILEPGGAPAPAGVPGELCVGGPGVARGYLGRPGLTAERFVPDPFAAGPGARLYRSGDLARWLKTGSAGGGDVEFLGRIDSQVKVRGFRIEPGEIEAALLTHPGVREAAVVQQDRAAGAGLLACLVPAESADPLEPAALRAFLLERLPAPFVPARFALLDALPRTPNGKLDRRALARLEAAAVPRPHVPPATPDEEQIAAIWEELLGHGPVGRHDHFFDLGGHSLLATQALSRLRERLGVRLPLRALFESPTVEGLAAAVEEARWEAAAAQPESAAAEPAEGRAYPLSFAQERLWFLEQLQPGTALYNMPAVARATGPLRPAALAAALAAVEARHGVLRTVFLDRAGQPLQEVRPPAGVPLPLVDLSSLPPAPREAELSRSAQVLARRPFDLGQGPPIRAALLRLGREDHTLVLTLHHIVSDGWSSGVLLREMATVYEAALQGRPAPLPPLRRQYAEWAALQREQLAGDRLAAQLDWWRAQLTGLPPLDLPADRPRPATASGQGRQRMLELPAAVAAALHAGTRREGVTLFMLLLGAFQALLARYSGQADLAVGTPVANRGRSDVEGLIGLFANTVALRTDLAGDPAFREVLRRVRETTLGAYAHEETPFEKIVDAVQPERDLSRTPIFQTMLVLQNQPIPELRMGALRLSPWELDTGVSKFDLTLVWREDAGRLVGLVESSTDLFDEPTVARFCAAYRRLLEGALERPEAPLSELPLLGAEERAQLLAWSRGPGSPPAEGDTLHGMFEARARRAPDAPALAAAGRVWTYGELDRASTALAGTLRARGVGPEVRVGLLADRSAELAVGMLAILKAGGAFVPLDPAYPKERLELLVEDSGAALVLHQGPEGLEGLQGRPRPQWLSLEAPPSWESLESFPSFAAPVLPHALAYLIYTSGSTGRPKAVAVSHANAVPLFAWSLAAFGLGPHTRVLQTLSPAFDFGVWEVLTTLLAGGTLHMAGRETAADPAAWAAYAAAHGIDTVHATPSFFREVAALGVPLPAVRVLHLGGEALLRADAERMRAVIAQDPAGRVFNGYGPTEATVNCLLFEVDGPAAGPAFPVAPIGRPSAENTVHVLEPAGTPAPAGVPGELFVGGPGVARGYLGRPDLTAERFLPDPFSAAPGGRIYRSGDRARWVPAGGSGGTGVIEFLGRLDQQVKLRGLRVELGEIEAALLAGPGVREAAVVLRDGAAGPELFACLVPQVADGPPAVEALRQSLLERLPAPLVPARFAFLDALPLTPNGKLDRRALTHIEPAAPARPSEPPSTPLEKRIAEIWQELLRVPQVGRQDSFFELGGHSLLAAQVLARLRARLGVEIPLRTLFEHPTLAELATAIKTGYRRAEPAGGGAAAGPATAEASLPVRRDWTTADRPLSFSQERLWFLEQLEPDTSRYHILGRARMSGDLRPGALAGAIRETVRRHEALRTVFPAVDGRAVQRVLAAGDPAAEPVLARIDLRALPEEARAAEARRAASQFAQRPFRLAADPLLRTALLWTAPTEHDFLLVVHHIVADGWSIGLLVREVGLLYAAAAEGRPSPLPEPALQCSDFAAWQRERLAGAYLAEQLRYWRFKLAGTPPVLELPADRPRPAVRSGRGGAVALWIPPAVLRGLAAVGRAQGGTLFMLLLAALQIVLRRATGRDDIAVGAPIANRDALPLEGVVGLLVNTLVMRTRVPGDPAFSELLAEVAETALGAYAHQDLPFEKLVETLAPERSLAATPLVQVLLTLQNTPGGEAELAGVHITHLPVDSGSAKFDLTISLAEANGGIAGRWGYDADLFEPPTAARLAGHFQTVLAGIAGLAEGSDRPLSELPLLSEAERQALLVEWEGDALVLPEDGLAHERILAWAARRPAATAVEWTDGEDGTDRLSYGELDRASRRLAAGLRRLGAGRGTVVGVLAERSPGQVAGMLAVLRSGGVYLPLDPAYPAARLAAMVEDGGVAALIAPRHHRDAVPDLAGLPWLDPLAAVTALEDAEDCAAADPALDPAELAYVIFTSGSTGRPKGVGVPHEALRNRLLAAQAVLPLAEGDAVLQIAPLGFDFSVWELLAPLTEGARLVLARPGEQSDPESLTRTIERHGVTVTHFVPSMLEVFLAAGGLDRCGSLRLVFSGGEALSPALRDRFFERLPETRLVNQYGPTEATIDATWHPLERPLPGGKAEPVVPIGRAFPNCAVRVLDAAFALTPPGSAGELVLGGACLARGYLGRPDLTAERFVPDPFGAAGDRLYRTGDLARWLQEGRIAYLGRIDGQVKVRGVRIEPAEVEAALRRLPGVRQAAVVALEDLPGGAALVAYLVPDGPAATVELEEGALRTALRATLPAFLVPAFFVVLDSLPLNAAGKLDRRALPRPGADRRQDASYVAPRSPLEETLAEIWAAVLHRSPVGVHDNFFEIGGHSLLAIQVLSRLRDALGIELPVRTLFESPTVAELSVAVVTLMMEAAGEADLEAMLGELEEDPNLSPVV